MQITKFIKEVRGEMNNVKWPTKKMIMGSAFGVVLISLIVAAMLGGLDYGLQKALTTFVN